MIGVPRFAEGVQVATHTLRRKPEPVELPDSANFMARVTIHHRMRADQRKSILVLVDVVDRDLPAIWVMAQFALRPILSAMKICMAVLTLFWHMAEYEVGMTIHALYLRVPSVQRKIGSRMLELHSCSQRLPSLLAVTLLAGNIELLSVRTVSSRICGSVLRNANTCSQKEHEQ